MAGTKTYIPRGNSGIKETLVRLRQAETPQQVELEMGLLMRAVKALAISIGLKWLSNDYEAANEVAEEVCTRFFLNLDQMVPEKSPQAWVSRVTEHCLSDCLQRRKYMRNYLAEAEYAASTKVRCSVFTHHQYEDLLKEIDELPLIQRAIAKRNLVHGERVKDIAAAIGLHPRTVSARLEAAKRRLRERISRKR